MSDRKPLLRVFKRFSIFAVGSKIGFRDRIRMNNSRSSQTIRSKASPLPPGSNVRRSPSQENMPDTTSPGKVQKSWSFNDRTRFRTSLRLKPRPPADGIYWTGITGIVSVYLHLCRHSGGGWGGKHGGQTVLRRGHGGGYSCSEDAHPGRQVSPEHITIKAGSVWLNVIR